MKVVKSAKTVVYGLKDYFVKELANFDVEKYDVVRRVEINDRIITVGANLIDDTIELAVNEFDKKSGVEFGSRLYHIDIFNCDLEKERIRLPHPVVGAVIIELLQSYDVDFSDLGEGIISSWLLNDLESCQSKIWFSSDLNFISITRKPLEPVEQLISKESLLDSLGF